VTPIFAKGNKRTLARLRNFRKEAHHDKVPRVALRVQAIMLSIEGSTCRQIAKSLQVSRGRVYEWVIAWNQHGIEGLKEGHRSGRPKGLTERQLELLKDIVDSGPLANGLNSGVWTSPLVAEIIFEEFGVSYHPGHVRKILNQIGLSVQRPTTQIAAADIKAQRKWTRYTYPNLKKTPKKTGH